MSGIGRVAGLGIGIVAIGGSCDLAGGRPDDDQDRLEASILESLEGPLGQAAAYASNEANWVEGGGETDGEGAATGASCANACGGASSDNSCYCDEQCTNNGDCCSDYANACGGGGQDGDTSEGGGAGTCSGACGGASSDSSCYCDEQCTSNGDCCSDYGQHCGGAGSGGDSGADSSGDSGDSSGDPPGAGTCAGFCGGAGSDGNCYCDESCTTNGDCCSDYGQQCGGAGSGGDSGDDSGDGSGGDPGSCAGGCGGAGSDGLCYCDESCVTNGDCCSDYDVQCGVGIAADPTFDLSGAARTAADGGGCWGLLTDPVDVAQVATYAAGGGALLGGSCVAVLVVPASAGAVPTAGVSVGAAALACSGYALYGSLTGAISSLVSQKMGSLAECSASVMAEVRQFAWGKGEQVLNVPTFGEPADPGDCTPDEHRNLQDKVNSTCKNSGTRSCTVTDGCGTLTTKLSLSAECIAARSKINSVCFNGGDEGHNQAITQEQNLQNTCHNRISAAGC